MRFLHISDIHLGFPQYQLLERTKDFGRAWASVLSKYAIENPVDFVLICGDFFHKRNADPMALNHAVGGLNMLRERGIPVVAIEGNHDQTIDNESQYSWIRSLKDWGLIKLLEPEMKNGKADYQEWDEVKKNGSFIDIGRARIFGSRWYSSSANATIPLLVDGIKENGRENAFQILMLHTDVEGYTNSRHHIAALSMSALKELKSVTHYVALGHTHKRIEIENWAFNPGSLEACTIDEYREERGAFLVEIDDENKVNAKFVRDYQQRRFNRLFFDVSGLAKTQEVTEGIIEQVKREVSPRQSRESEPIVEITLRGHLGFQTSLLELDEIRAKVNELTQALQVRVKNNTVPVEYAIAAGLSQTATREERERHVIEGLVTQNNQFKHRATEMAEVVIGTKKMILGEEDAEKILDFISMKTA